MPVRVYDISKKLGLENKLILAVARELGIAAARVPSSSLDRTTAEWLEKHILAKFPEIAAKLELPPILQKPKSVLPEAKFVGTSALLAQMQIEKVDEDSLAIRLKSDALVEIYSFGGSDFQSLGSFAFQLERDSAVQNTERKRAEPEEIILLTNNEGVTLEFKPSARWDCYQNRANPDLQKAIVKTIAAFLNTEGGTLLIGVADNGKILGLKQDFATLQKPKGDDYILFLSNIIFDNLGHDLGSCLDISILRLKGKEICRIGVRKSPRPVYVKDGQNEQFYVRFSNASKNLSIKAAVEYCKNRWPTNK